MYKYKSADRDTGVIAYETGKYKISIKFGDGAVYS